MTVILVLIVVILGFFGWHDLRNWLDRDKPRDYFVLGEKTPFTGMNTGSPGATDITVVGERMTAREARRLARMWVRRFTHGAATVGNTPGGVCPEDLRREKDGWQR